MDAGTIILFWLVCGLLAGSINHGKGHSFAAGFVLGVLLGPVGVILAALSNKVDPATAICPYCKEHIIPGALICKHCGSKLAKQIGEKVI